MWVCGYVGMFARISPNHAILDILVCWYAGIIDLRVSQLAIFMFVDIFVHNYTF